MGKVSNLLPSLPPPLRYSISELSAAWGVYDNYIWQQIESGQLQAVYYHGKKFHNFPDARHAEIAGLVISVEGDAIIFGTISSVGEEDGKMALYSDDLRLISKDDVFILHEAKSAFEKHSIGQRANEVELSENLRATLLKHIAALAMVIGEKKGRYSRGSKPNAVRIAETAADLVVAIPGAGGHGLGSESIRKNIAAGLKLLQSEE